MLTPIGQNQGELIAFLKALRNSPEGKAGLAVGTTTTRIQITNQTDFNINGALYRKAATDNISIAALTATAALQTSRVRVEIDSAGTVTFKQGAVVGGAAGHGIAPIRTASRCTLGIFDMPASFTPGTSVASLCTFTDGDPDLGILPQADDSPSLEA